MQKYDAKVKNRLKRIEGQVRGIIKMMDEEKQCQDVVTQLAAVRNALDRAIGVVVSSNLEECIRRQIENGEGTEETIKEAVNLLVKSR
ncbi:metal-sensitive transcriptional regulator [Anaerobacillus isosaccharinicus]|uniref:Cytoplasmic protein n=1 Tax=Anaerobacillus isosaccharinicus TaxID=1532552 RepID=A0A1S2MG00_9BACI|nr:metal-sensitive transcriptional regulator [Anaerobacillus isosaccharinicus]MBA5588839.1 metal-sensitive transcriptional regulator [Anaerobacillus isosaccharinicus]QOY37770.1 metal-sensitive transcriptional regulator [Anaerobacillus isosaccharinicus]